MADSLLFDGTDDKITISLGNLPFQFGPGTVAAIVKRTSDVTPAVFQAGLSSSVRYLLYLNGTQLQLFLNSSGAGAASVTLAIADGWALIAATKDGGTVAPRMHRYLYGTSTWTHANASATLANSSVPGTNAWLGASEAEFFGGDILLVGVWNSVLSDGELEGLTGGLQAWYDLAPRELWRCDRMSKISSLIGSGQSYETARTGTTLDTGDVPAGWDDSLVTLPPTPIPGANRWAKFPKPLLRAA